MINSDSCDKLRFIKLDSTCTVSSNCPYFIIWINASHHYQQIKLIVMQGERIKEVVVAKWGFNKNTPVLSVPKLIGIQIFYLGQFGYRKHI